MGLLTAVVEEDFFEGEEGEEGEEDEGFLPLPKKFFIWAKAQKVRYKKT